MQTAIPKKWYGLDHLRAIAILMVFFFHYSILSNGKPDWLPNVVQFGWTGVDLFFVLSGFLISSQLFLQIKTGSIISFRTFFLKRFFRIIPVYLFTVLVYFCFPFFREKEALPPLWKFLTFTQNIGLNAMNFGTFSHAWSLCVEEHFYLFLPAVLLIFQKNNWLKKSYFLLIILFILGFFIRAWIYNNYYLPVSDDEYGGVYWYQYIYYPTYTRLDGLLVGVSIAAIFHFLPTIWNKIEKWGNWLVLFSLIVFTTVLIFFGDNLTFKDSVFVFPIVDFGFGILVIAALSKKSFLYKWQSSATTFLANISYALYLIHKIVIHLVHHFFANTSISANLLMLCSLIASIIVAFLMHVCIEKPFMRLRNKIV